MITTQQLLSTQMPLDHVNMVLLGDSAVGRFQVAHNYSILLQYIAHPIDCDCNTIGKSSLAFRFKQNNFLEYPEATIVAELVTQTMPVDGTDVTFEIWDLYVPHSLTFDMYCQLTTTTTGEDRRN